MYIVKHMEDKQVQTSLRMAALMARYLDQSLSDAEREALEQWLAANDSNRKAMEELLDDESAGEEWRSLAYYQARASHAKDRVTARLERRSRQRARRTVYYSAAAVALVLISALSFMWTTRTSREPAGVAFAFTGDVAPGGQKAQLVLANGSSIVLNAHNDTSFTQGGTSVQVQQQLGLLAYEDFSNNSLDIQYHQLITPKGGEYHLQLEDGTHVWLNAASSIRFPTRFTGAERRVELTGEAYFEVAKDTKHPFIVDVNNRASIEVLGTHFNVNAYIDEDNISTTLLEGAVAVTTGSDRRRIAPGQQAIVSSQGDHAVMVAPADTVRAVAWKNGIFDFNDARLTEVMRQVSRWYDIDIIYEKGIPDIRVWGRMQRNQNLQQLIRILNGMDVKAKLEDGRKLVVLP